MKSGKIGFCGIFAAFALAASLGLSARAEPANFYADANGVLHISNRAGLMEFRDQANAGVIKGLNQTGGHTNVVLDADIDLESEEWTPINTSCVDFDGQNHVVANLRVSGNAKNVGLFGAASISTVKNLTVSNAIVVGINHVAAIAGDGLCGHFINCKVYNATITANVYNNDDGDKAGAICGYLSGESDAEVTNCTVENCTITGYRDIGGAVGYANGTATVTGTTVKDTAVINDRSNNYKNYKTNAAFDVNEIIGETSSSATVKDNTATDVTVKVAVAKVDGASYADLATALNAAKADGSVCELLCDIDLKGAAWTPIADFQGDFDGKGYSISGLNVDVTTDNAGLFGNASEGVLRNVTLVSPSVKGAGSCVAALVGAGFRENVYNVVVTNATVVGGNQYVGGVCGGTYCSIVDSKVLDSTITGKDQVGGVIGYICGAGVKGCTVTGNAITATAERAGGLVGKINIGDSATQYFSDNVISGSATAPDMAGGIAAQIMGGDADYEIRNNDIDVVLSAAKVSPIGVLRPSQPVAFTGALEANITGTTWSDATTNANSYVYTAAETGAGDQVINRDNPSVKVITDIQSANEATVVTKKTTAEAQLTDLTNPVATALAEEVTVGGKTTTVAEQIEQTTKVEGVKLTTNETVKVTEEISVSGPQAVVSTAKLQAAAVATNENATAEQKAAAEAFTNTVVTAQTVEVKVEVKVVPTAYVKPAEETVATVAFKLEPQATVKVLDDNKAVLAEQIVDVSNDMIDQTQPITVSLFTGFQPVQIVHRDDAGNVIDNFTGSDISYDSATGIATVEISHFSSLTAYDAEQALPVAKVGDTTYTTLAAAVTDASAIANSTITLLADCTVESEITINNGNIRTIDGTNSVAGGYYTITVVDGGKLTIDYSSMYKSLDLRANVTDARTSGAGLVLNGKYASYMNVCGNVTATADDTTGLANYCGQLTAGTLSVAGATYKGAVNARAISDGLFYGTLTVPAKSITGGKYYTGVSLDVVKAAMADGYSLIRYPMSNPVYTYSQVLPTSSVVCVLKHGDELTNYASVSTANYQAVDGDTVTVVANLSSAPVKLGIPLIVKSGVTVTTVSAEASTCKVTGPVLDAEGNGTYTAVTLTIDDAETKAYVVSGDTTNCYNAVKSAVSAGVAGDKVYLKDDYEGTLYPKTGTELYLNGHAVTAVKANNNDAVVEYDEGADKWVARLRTADDEDAVASVDYASDGKLHYFASLANAFSAMRYYGTTVTLLKDISIGDSDYSGSYMMGNYVSLSTGKTINGNGHTLTYTGTQTPYFVYSTYGTVTNMTFAGMRNAIVYSAYSGTTFDQVKITGLFENAGHNFGAYAVYQRGTATFRNCEMAANCFDNGGKEDYNAAFIGYISSASTLNFDNCRMTGNLTCGTAGMFFANCAYQIAITLNIKDTYNEGLIQAVYLADQEESLPYKFNPFTAVSWDGQLNRLTVNLDNENLQGTYSGTAELTSAALFEAMKRNNGQFLNGPTDAALALAKNDRGGFAATTAANADAAKYVISVGVYASLSFYGQSAGSSFFNVTETIATDQHGVKVLPIIMDYRFVDATWVAANPTAVPGTHCGATTYTLNDETFYYVEEGDNPAKRTLWGNVSSAECYTISAYDADNNLLASATLSSSACTLKTSATAPNATVTYLYDTLETAVQNVEQDGTITILADNSETFTAAPKSGVTAFTVDNTADYDVTGTITSPEGYEFKDNGDGTWSFQQVASVAEIVETGKRYATLAGAVANVAEGQTVQMLVESVDEAIPNYGTAKAFTLKGLADGYTSIAGAASAAGAGLSENNVTFENINWTAPFDHRNMANVLFRNCRFTGTYGVYYGYASGAWTFVDCDFEQTGNYAAHFDEGKGVALSFTNCYIRGKVNGLEATYANTVTFCGCEFDGGADITGDGKYSAEIKYRADATFDDCLFSGKFAAGLADACNKDDNGINIVAGYTYTFVDCEIEDSSDSVATLVVPKNLKDGAKAVIDAEKNDQGNYTEGTFVVNDTGAIALAEGKRLVNIGTKVYTIVDVYAITYELGTGSPEGAAVPTSPTDYILSATETTLPKPTYDSESMTFNGWSSADPAFVGNAIPAGTTGALTLTATWISAQVIEVKTNATEQTPTVAIRVTQEWIDTNVTEKKAEEPTTEEIQATLNKEDPNGNMKWQNYVIGLDPTNQVAGIAEQNDDEKTITVVPNAVTPQADTGFTVRYSLDTVETNGTVVAEGAATTMDNLSIDLDAVETNAYFKVNVIVTKDGAAASDATKVAATNTLGVLKVAKAPKTAIVAVPWNEIGGEAVTVSNLVKTANLSENDELYVYGTNGEYTTWHLNEDKNWVSSGEGGESAAAVTVPRGSAVWLTRSDSAKPIVLFGQVADPAAQAESTLEKKKDNGKPSWNIVAAPSVEALDLNEKFTAEAKTSIATDRVIVPTDGAPKTYTFKDNQWGYAEARAVTNNLGKVRAISVRVTDDTKVPAGTGFMYLNSDSVESKVKW